MQRVITFYGTSVGKKAVMAVSGGMLYGFVVGHLLGNLQVYLGPAALNGYARQLQQLGPLLWGVRSVLLLVLLAHLVPAFQLTLATWSARGGRYRVRSDAATTYAARTMIVTGPLLLAFVLFHLVHFTAPGVAMSSGYEHSFGDVYSNVVSGFSVGWVTALYLLAQLALCYHLYHGGASMLQTLGLDPPQSGPWPRRIAEGLAVLIGIGNSSIPIAVWIGVVR